MVSARVTGRDLQATGSRRKRFAYDYRFPILDYLIFCTLLSGDMYSNQINKCINDLPVQGVLRQTLISSRLNSLAREGFVTYRKESGTRRLYFSITDKGKGRLHEICLLTEFLNEMAKSATIELAGYLLARRRRRLAEASGLMVERT